MATYNVYTDPNKKYPSGTPQIINFDPNTGQKLAPGQSVVDKNTGKTVTQGQVFTPTPNLSNIQTQVSNIASQIPKLTQQVNTVKPAVKPVETTTPTIQKAPELNTNSATAESNLAYLNSVSDQVAASRKAVEDAYKIQIDSYKKQQEESQKKIDELRTKSEDVLGNVEELTKPFQQKLETSERERLLVEKNYFDNQQSVGELEKLMNQAVADTEAAQSTTSLSAIKTPRVNQIKTDYEARVGVINAVMNARNNQISVAENMIDRSVQAIYNDKQSQLGYYNTVLDFYEGLRTEEGNKLISLTKEEQTYAKAQISLLENDLAQAQETADYVKKLMVDPQSANIVEKAGVTLTDSVSTINKKIATYTAQQNVEEQKNKLTADGYTYVPFPTNTSNLASFVIDGKEYWFKKPEEETWSTPYSLGGDWVQKNSKTGEIRTAVNVPKGTTETGEGLFTKAEVAKMEAGGLSVSLASNIYKAIIKGETLEEIRQDLKAMNYDPRLLDIFDMAKPIYKILNQKNPNSSNTEDIDSLIKALVNT